MVKISIIMPIYNGEKYLNKAIESIINQSYDNYELILVDDGSKDNTREICQSYTKNNKVKYYHIENSGVSSARNFGIDKCTGEYITFLDADDYFDLKALEKYNDVITKNDYDLIITSYNEVYKNNTISHNFGYDKQINDNLDPIIFEIAGVEGFLCNKLYKSVIIKENRLELSKEITYCEDLLFNCKYLEHSNSVYIANFVTLNYRMSRSSATWNLNNCKINQLFNVFSKIEENSNVLENIYYKYYKLNLILKLSINKKKYVKDYKHLINSNLISCKAKIKLLIMFRFNFIYRFYMILKTKKNKLFE